MGTSQNRALWEKSLWLEAWLPDLHLHSQLGFSIRRKITPVDRGTFLLLFKLLTQPAILKKAHYPSTPPSFATAFRDGAPSFACKPAWEKGRAVGRGQRTFLRFRKPAHPSVPLLTRCADSWGWQREFPQRKPRGWPGTPSGTCRSRICWFQRERGCRSTLCQKSV